MAQAYTPGLEVTEKTRVSKLRELPLPGRTLVKVGDTVKANTPVLAADLPGEIEIVRIADRMGLDPEDVVPAITVKVGDIVKAGDLLCEVKTFFGWFTHRYNSPASGVVEFFTAANAHLGLRQESIPLEVDAYISGVITAVEEGKNVTIETDAAVIQGIFGVGGERHGEILTLDVKQDAIVESADIGSRELKNKIVVGGSAFSIAALREAAMLGAAAVVTGSIDAETLRGFVGHEIGVSITGDEDVPFTLIITEGFGNLPISKRVVDLATKLEGRFASVNGATQVRAGAMRPEVIAPAEGVARSQTDPSEAPRALEVGVEIRMIRVPYFGKLGKVTDLPHDPELIPSGAKVRVLKARLEDGTEVTIPRANVELV